MQVWHVLQAARWKYRTQEIAKKSPSAHHHTTLSGCIFASKGRIDNRKKILTSNTSSTCPQNMANFGPLTADIGSGVLGTSENFNGFRVLASLLATSLTGGQRNFARCLAVYWTATWNIHFRGLLPPNGILPCAKCTLRPILAFSYIGSVTARTPAAGVSQTLRRWTQGATYIRQGGHHVGHWATF